MNSNFFYILQGNNGATYILNTQSWRQICQSLAFYKALNLKGKILKTLLTFYLFWAYKLKFVGLKTKAEVGNYVNGLSPHELALNLSDNCSLHISPNRNKIIVNYHNGQFTKIGFGGSFSNVKHEAQMYKLFQGSYCYFRTSQLSNYQEYECKACSFTLTNGPSEKLSAKIKPNWTLVLGELFKISSPKTQALEVHINEFLANLKGNASFNFEKQQSYLQNLSLSHGQTKFSLGFVHGDFKPWNVILQAPPLIYDFEEANPHGLPLQDLFNYSIDPIIRYQSVNKVAQTIMNPLQIESYKSYLSSLNIALNYEILLNFYLIERILFWGKNEQNETAQSYYVLSNYILDGIK
jgi:hypothetical protein